MKKLLFALEVLLMLSALPVFFGLALGRKHHVTPEIQKNVSSAVRRDAADALVLYTGTVKNS